MIIRHNGRRTNTFCYYGVPEGNFHHKGAITRSTCYNDWHRLIDLRVLYQTEQQTLAEVDWRVSLLKGYFIDDGEGGLWLRPYCDMTFVATRRFL